MKNINIKKSVICPACIKESSLQYPNPRLYVAANRESDQHITDYTWLHGIKTDIIPHHYSVWQCPFCLFTDFKENIENFEKTTKNRKMLDSFKQAEKNNSFNILKGLRRLSGKGHDAQVAIALHLSAIFISSLPEGLDNRDNQKLGRLYLRLGWIFRELSPKKKTEQEDNVDNKSGYITDIFNSIEQLEHHYISFVEELSKTRELANIRADKKNIKYGSKYDPYHPIIESISDKLNLLKTTIEIARQTVTEDKEGRLIIFETDNTNISNTVFQKLQQLLPLWSKMPINEKAALNKAVDSFDYSFRKEDSDRSSEQGMSLINLILKILIKIGDLERALDYINQIYKMGFRDKQSLQTRLNTGKQNKSLSNYDIQMINKKISSLSMSISRAGENRKSIFQIIFKKKENEIRKIITDNPKISSDQLKQLLTNSGINEEMLPFLEENGVLKINSKKGWFGKK